MSKSKRRPVPVLGRPIIETHCHLDYLKQDTTPAILSEAQRVGIERVVTIGVAPDNLAAVRELTSAHPIVWGTQGIHPHEAEQYSDQVEVQIREHIDGDKIVAVGEIGLDYYYDHADRAVQRRVFERQLQIAVDHEKPIVVHSREADEDTAAILANFADKLNRKGVIHSFTSGLKLAEQCLEMGFSLGFNGIVTFNRADNVREALAITPLDRVLLETDSPYLTPVPWRGVENAPFYLPFVAEKVAEVKATSIEQVLQQCYGNSLQLFWPNEATA